MNRKIVFSAAVIALGGLGVVSLFLPTLKLFPLVVLAFLLVGTALLGVVLFEIRNTRRLIRRNHKAFQKWKLPEDNAVLRQLELQSTALQRVALEQVKSGSNTAKYSKSEQVKVDDILETFGSEQNATIVNFKNEFRTLLASERETIMRAHEIGVQRQVSYFDSIRNILEDIEERAKNHGEAVDQGIANDRSACDLGGVTSKTEAQDAPVLRALADDNFDALKSEFREFMKEIQSETEFLTGKLRDLQGQSDTVLGRLQQTEDYSSTPTAGGIGEKLDVILEKFVELRAVLQSQNSWNVSNFATQFHKLAEAIAFVDEKVQKAIEPELIGGTLEKSFARFEKDLLSEMAEDRQRLFYQLRVAMYEETQETEALLRLESRIQPRSTMPSLGRWAIDAKSMLQLADLFEKVKPRFVVEIGSGTSSVWLGYLAEKYESSVVTIEHDESFAMRTRELLLEHSLQNIVEVKHAPLTDIEIGEHTHLWYETDFIAGLNEVDLLFVDGPVGSSSEKARYPALPLLVNKLSRNAVVVLDDTHRDDEEAIAKQWISEYGLERVDHSMSRLAILQK